MIGMYIVMLLFPIFTSSHDLLTITIVSTAQIAGPVFLRFLRYLSFAQGISQSCYQVLKDHEVVTALLMQISLPDLNADPRSHAKCSFVKKKIEKNIIVV